MQLLEGIASILAIFLYILLLAVLSFGILFGIAAVMGVAGSVLSIPLLYVLPDVRRFLLLASGGAPDDQTPPWRVAVRPRYLLLSMLFGVSYGVVFLVLFIPFRELRLVHASVGPVPLLLGIPLSFVTLAVPLAFGIQRTSSAWTETTDSRSVLVQWIVFLTVVVTLGTAVPVVVTQL
ncbi:hypothetical protein Harman_04520 [Haloarcula mannanilytica]|uniref:Uncharacterized protein n=1 Tax=Haloarcula mannanilytica TaxID=2509225 RepID=A0A4C2EFN4_9EURY|nr:hypothetical protein [Haloarcula mannanilytica]GCF12517.1 hypothetical protein Harman_04520 [Haloarcula mannanilytica]